MRKNSSNPTARSASRYSRRLASSRRIVVIGTTGTGKTTMGRQLSRLLDIPHTELDALHWDPNWTEAPVDVFRERVARALQGDAWVVDGNYSKARDIVWRRADTIVWLDYPLPVILWRLGRRTFRRLATREQLWNGNRESWRSHFLSRDSLFLWVFQTYWKRRRLFPQLLQRPEYAQARVLRLYSPQAARTWLSRLAASTRQESGRLGKF
ncbi:MAG: adenylate kinase [Dehalococcoidia bacterium]